MKNILSIFSCLLFAIFITGCSGAQIGPDEETQSAVGAIAEVVGGSARVVKYCPITGKRYSPKLKTCPVHNVALEELED